MRTQTRLQRILTGISLLGLALGFSVLGFMIVVNQHDGGASIAGGILGVLLGAAFLIAACLHWKCSIQIQDGFRADEVPAAGIVSQTRRDAGIRDFQPLAAPPPWGRGYTVTFRPDPHAATH
jgi:hypothetical protein